MKINHQIVIMYTDRVGKIKCLKNSVQMEFLTGMNMDKKRKKQIIN